MRYLFISDIHGQFNKMITALDNYGFDPASDTLVTLGDLFDRGPNSKRILEYCSALPNWIPVWGNHDRRLRELMLGQPSYNYDVSNGVPQTINSFLNRESESDSIDIKVGINLFLTDDRFAATRALLWNYFDRCIFALEFKDLIATHAWIPTVKSSKIPMKYDFFPQWREVSHEYWDDATWSNTKYCVLWDTYEEDKKLLVGHWHAWRIREDFLNEKFFEYNFNTLDWDMIRTDFGTMVEYKNYIFIDGCVNLEQGQVIVYEYITDETPIFYN